MIGRDSHPRGDDVTQAQAEYEADSDTDANAHASGGGRHLENIPACCSQWHANPEFNRALRDRIRKNAVQPYPERKRATIENPPNRAEMSLPLAHSGSFLIQVSRSAMTP